MDRKVAVLFGYLGEKLMFSAERIRRKCPGKLQPVRVTLNKAATVYGLLSKAKTLKESNEYDKVF